MRKIPLSRVGLPVNEASFSRVKRFINSGSDRRLVVAHTELLQGLYQDLNYRASASVERCLQMKERASSPEMDENCHLLPPKTSKMFHIMEHPTRVPTPPEPPSSLHVPDHRQLGPEMSPPVLATSPWHPPPLIRHQRTNRAASARRPW